MSVSRTIVMFWMLLLVLAGCRLPIADGENATPAASPPMTENGAIAVSPPSDVLRPGASWQWQLAEPPVDVSIDAQVFDIDLFDNDAGVVAALQAEDRLVFCYMSAGSWEDWRSDAAEFPPEVLGRAYVGWPGERWVDIRRLDLLGPILRRRLDICRDKGFDGVEPDNIDGYANDTGFLLTYADQLTFNRWLAEEAHARGLTIGLKNNPEQAAVLAPVFDWALTEDCYVDGWCAEMAPFLKAGKPVFAAEYADTGVDFVAACQALQPAGYSLLLKERELTAWRESCPE